MRVLVVASLLAIATPASAQPAPDPRKQAEVLYNEGTKHYNLREYPEAIAAFKEAYRLMSEPLFLYNIAQSYRLSNDCANAYTFYKTYLRDAPKDPDRAKIENWIVELEPCAKAAAAKPIEPVTPPGDKPADPVKPADAPITTTGEVVVLPPPPPPAPRNNLRIAGLATLGGGVVLAGIGIAFSVRATNAASDLEAACKTGCDAGAVAAIDDRGTSAQRNATIFYIAGGAAAAVGAGLLIYSTITRRSETVALTPTHGGAVATAAFSF